MSEATPATPSNFVELMEGMSVMEVLTRASEIHARLTELDIDGDGGYWLEKPWKFPEYWVPALNGTILEADLEAGE